MKAHQAFISLAGRNVLLTGFGLTSGARTCVVIVPPFAEELNRCRRMMALQGRALATAGVACCYADLSGTGDSDSAFADASWVHWVEETIALLGHLHDEYGFAQFDLLGIRLGVVLAAECAAGAVQPVRQLIGWQPVADGGTHIRQFLRMRTMASMLGGEAKRERVADLRQQLGEQGMLEVGGYMLTDRLAAAIENTRLADALPSSGCRLAWLEVQDKEEPVLTPASRRISEKLGEHVSLARAVSGQPFWSTIEIGVSQALVEATTELVS